MYTNFLFDIYMQISKSTSSPFPNQMMAFLFKPIFLLGVHVLSMKLSISVSQNQESSLTLCTLSHPVNKLLFEYVSNSSILLYLYYCHLLSCLVLQAQLLLHWIYSLYLHCIQGESFNTRAHHDTVLLYLENLEESCCFWIKAKTLSITLKTFVIWSFLHRSISPILLLLSNLHPRKLPHIILTSFSFPFTCHALSFDNITV